MKHGKLPAFLPKEEMAKKYHTVTIDVDNKPYKFDLISIGNPHAVCFVEDLQKIDVEKVGSFVENYKYFPNKINVEFVQIIDKQNLKIKVWERGVGKTISCGTGACAASICAIKKEMVNKNVTINLDGGRLYINYDEENGVDLTGGAEFCFEGKLEL